MKKLFVALATLLFVGSAFAVELSSLRESLRKAAPSDYYPENGEYRLFQNVCNPAACFHVVSVFYVSISKKGMRRLAVFSKEGKYLGSYSGFSASPVSSGGAVVQFPKSNYSDQIKFENKNPPKQVWIDGEIFSFEEAL